uniref:Rho-related GTP-binding protein RhoC n=2 Tax=Macrostomum lignano TaxID=282301 RepID=A0A1I8JAM8_9PLAT
MPRKWCSWSWSPTHQESSPKPSRVQTSIKCLAVGDRAVGKSSLLLTLAHEGARLVFSIKQNSLTIPERTRKLFLLDIGCFEGDSNRQVNIDYSQADVLLVCFSLVGQGSFESVQTRWHAELSQRCPEIPIILVGTKLDLRNDSSTIVRLKERDQAPITNQQGMTMAKKINAMSYLECSALICDGLTEVIGAIVRSSVSGSSRALVTVARKPNHRSSIIDAPTEDCDNDDCVYDLLQDAATGILTAPEAEPCSEYEIVDSDDESNGNNASSNNRHYEKTELKHAVQTDILQQRDDLAENSANGEEERKHADFTSTKMDKVSEQELRQPTTKRKIVLIGDEGVGKTCLILSHAKRICPADYVPTEADDCIPSSDGSADLGLWDLSGSRDFDRVRPESYGLAGPVPSTFDSVLNRWRPEVARYCPDAPIILVGTKADLRTDPVALKRLRRMRLVPIAPTHGDDLAKEIGAVAYLECSALHRIGIDDLFKKASQCFNLRHKPKAFFIQACRGSDNESEKDTQVDKFVSDNTGLHCPLDSDFLLCYATTEGYSALRDKEGGSPFVQTLCDVLEERHSSEHLVDIMTNVNCRLKENPIKEKSQNLYSVTETVTSSAKKLVGSLIAAIMRMIKCVIVGDSTAGKTCMIETYVNGSMPDTFIPTIYKTYSARLPMESESIELALTDTGGSEGYDTLRPVAYPQTDVFIICLDLTKSAELVLGNVRTKWYPELSHHCPSARIILVGTKLDMRTGLKISETKEEDAEKNLTAEQANEFVKEINAAKYMECSSITQQGLKEVFEEAARLVLNSSDARNGKKKKNEHHGDSKKVVSFLHSLSSSRRNSETSIKQSVLSDGGTKDSETETSPDEPSIKSPSSIKAFFRGLRPGKTYSYNIASQQKSHDKKTKASSETCEPADTSSAEVLDQPQQPASSTQEAVSPELSEDEQPTSETESDDESSDTESASAQREPVSENLREPSSRVDYPETIVVFRTAESKTKSDTITLKVVIVGDEAVGKTSLLTAFAEDQCPQEYVPTETDDCFAVEGSLAGSQLCLRLWDVSCAESFDRLRPLRYRQSDVFIICFSLINSASFENVRAKWYPEVSRHCPEKPFILVGTNSDLRDDPETIDKLEERNLVPISVTQGEQLAKEIGAEVYLECSALCRTAVEDIFRQAVLASSSSMSSNKINCLAIGDEAVGKSCLIDCQLGIEFQRMHIPTDCFKKHSMESTLEGHTFQITLWDSPSKDECFVDMPSYPKANVVLLCFAIDCRASYENVRRKWFKRCRKLFHKASFILVGTKRDLRDSSTSISQFEGRDLRKIINAETYKECSALNPESVREVFEEIIFTKYNQTLSKTNKSRALSILPSKAIFWRRTKSSNEYRDFDYPLAGATGGADPDIYTCPSIDLYNRHGYMKADVQATNPTNAGCYNREATNEEYVYDYIDDELSESNKQDTIQQSPFKTDDLGLYHKPRKYLCHHHSFCLQYLTALKKRQVQMKAEQEERNKNIAAVVPALKLKINVVGDEKVGKTCLLVAYAEGLCPVEYVPTETDDCLSKEVQVDGYTIRVGLWDNSGSRDYDRMRPGNYEGTDVVLICFSIASPATFDSVRTRWLPEIALHCSNTPIILVGTKMDALDDRVEMEKLHRKRLAPISSLQATALAKDIGAELYIECSALRRSGLDSLFKAAVRAAFEKQKKILEVGSIQEKESSKTEASEPHDQLDEPHRDFDECNEFASNLLDPLNKLKFILHRNLLDPLNKLKFILHRNLLDPLNKLKFILHRNLLDPLNKLKFILHRNLLDPLNKLKFILHRNLEFRSKLRHKKGSPYVQTVCDVIEEMHKTEHLLDMLTIANDRLKKNPVLRDGNRLFVVSETLTRLSKKCFLDPGLASEFESNTEK